MNYEEVVREYAARKGLGDNVSFEEGVCHLEIAGRDVGFMEIPEIDRLLVWTVVMKCPEERVESFYRMLLKANFMEQGLKGGAFSLSDDNVVYAHRNFVPSDMEGERFAAEMHLFVHEIEEWYAGIADFHLVSHALEYVAEEVGPAQDAEDWMQV